MSVVYRRGEEIDTAGTRSLSTRGALIAFTRRLHGYIGWLVGPFLLIAAASGLLYALSPQIETWWYASALTAPAVGPTQPLAAQIEAARQVAGSRTQLIAVRPAPAAGQTTRVMFAAPGAGPSMHRAIFVDPVSAQVRGDLPVYGTSGSLPWRTAVDQFHRSLWLGHVGRVYSELAASWLWVAALGGLLLWCWRRPRARPSTARGHVAGWHARLGPWLLIGLLFLSITGLTWSQYAGERIGMLRAAWGWQTPSLDTHLVHTPDIATATAHHSTTAHPVRSAIDAKRFDRVLRIARTQGIDADRIEIRPPLSSGQAWTVAEIDRRWPTQVDVVAINADTGKVTHRQRFADYPLAAKLTRWGIDAHMGVLFGLWNQALLIAMALGLIGMILLGYAMAVLRWRAGRSRRPPVTCIQALRVLPGTVSGAVITLAVLLGWALPVLGASLLVLVLVDGACTLRAADWRRVTPMARH